MKTQECLIAEDNSMVVKVLEGLLENMGYTVSVCNNTTAAVEYIIAKKPTIAVLAINNSNMNAIKVLEKLVKQVHFTNVIVMTDHKEKALYHHAKTLGAKGYTLKTFPFSEIELCIKTVSNGGDYFSDLLESHLIQNELNIEYENLALLTTTELKILEMISNKKNTKQISAETYVAETTVETHRRNIAKKLNLPAGQNSLMLWALEHKVMIEGTSEEN